jgi:hypothetical protein
MTVEFLKCPECIRKVILKYMYTNFISHDEINATRYDL